MFVKELKPLASSNYRGRDTLAKPLASNTLNHAVGSPVPSAKLVL